jgi:predicted DNA-binding transcriptional regulator AlpA
MSDEAIQVMTERFDRLERLTLIGAKTVLDLEEAAMFTGFSIGHLYRLTSNRLIPHFKKSRKLYFKKSELEDWMLERKVMTDKEMESLATTYVATHKHGRK